MANLQNCTHNTTACLKWSGDVFGNLFFEKDESQMVTVKRAFLARNSIIVKEVRL